MKAGLALKHERSAVEVRVVQHEWCFSCVYACIPAESAYYDSASCAMPISISSAPSAPSM